MARPCVSVSCKLTTEMDTWMNTHTYRDSLKAFILSQNWFQRVSERVSSGRQFCSEQLDSSTSYAIPILSQGLKPPSPQGTNTSDPRHIQKHRSARFDWMEKHTAPFQSVKSRTQRWPRDGPVVKSSCCSSGEPEFSFQHSHQAAHNSLWPQFQAIQCYPVWSLQTHT